MNVGLRKKHPFASKTLVESIKPRNKTLLDIKTDIIHIRIIIPNVKRFDLIKLFLKGYCIAIKRKIETVAK
jgi:hypothetical protein